MIVAIFSALVVLIYPQPEEAGPALTSTFSIAAADTLSGEMGIAVASKVLDVGYIVPWAETGVGAVATQAMSNATYGPVGLEILRTGASAEETLDRLIESDPEFEHRQLGVVDPHGGSASFTGSETLDWAGGIAGPGYAIQGNILTGPEVVAEMEAAYLQTDGPLSERLLQALIAGDRAGGDSRGRQSAALLVVRAEGGYQGSSDRLVDIRVADSEDPLGDLERIYRIWEQWYLFPTYIESELRLENDYALEIMERYLTSNEIDAQVLNGFAWELATRKLYPERAIELAIRAHQLAPEDANIMDTVAESYYAASDFESAVEWERRALEIEPDNGFFREQLRKFLRTEQID